MTVEQCRGKHSSAAGEAVLDLIGQRCLRLMHMASKDEVKNGAMVIDVSALHEYLRELRQQGGREPGEKGEVHLP